jgi:hypothetical protein
MRLNFIHKCIQDNIITLKYINTDLQVADVLTKLIPVSALEFHTLRLMKGHYGILPKSSDLNRTAVKTEMLKNLNRLTYKIKYKAKT